MKGMDIVKRKSTFILMGLAVIPISLVLIFNGINNRMIYNLTNESGDRKVMQDLKLVSYQNRDMKYNQKVTITADGIKAEENKDMFMYNYSLSTKDNKDFFRTVNQDTSHAVGENERYLCAGYMGKRGVYDGIHMTLCIKDKNSGEVKTYKYSFEDDKNADEIYFPECIKISEGFFNVITEKIVPNKNNQNDDSDADRFMYNYKFDLSSGKLLKKVELGKDISDVIDYQCCKNIYYKLNDKADSKNNYAVYNVNDDCIKRFMLPAGFNVRKVNEYNGRTCLFSEDGQMIEMKSDGTFGEKKALLENDRKDVGHYIVQNVNVRDSKIFYVVSFYENKSDKCTKTMFKVFESETGKELYSTDITEKKFFDKTAHTAEGYHYELSNR